ncbi:MAG: mannosyltransferase [Rhodobacteraceae bacterium]|nr:mannosyltransferase [Paracoccaceae bacterium]
MRLVFDVQSLQSTSRLRGIGRYTRSLITAMLREEHTHEITLLLNGSFGNHDDVIADLRAHLPRVDYAVCHLPRPTAAQAPEDALRKSIAELIREAFIAELKPDLVHVFSPMEGFGDNVVTSIGRVAAPYPVTSTFYDLIPLLNPKEYLSTNAAFNSHYQARLENLRRADGLLAISHFSAGEAADQLDYPADKIGVASLGPLVSEDVDRADADEVLKMLNAIALSPGFLLYVGGSDPRKNLPRLVQAWCLLPEQLQHQHPLVMVGWMPRQDVAALKGIASAKSAAPQQLRFLGQISDELLAHLYVQCSAFVFPSWHEGFGLPALEAMAMGAPVIAANASSLSEVVGLEEALFDPFEVEDISRLMGRVLADPIYRERLCEHAPLQAAKFSWQQTARDALRFFEHTHAAHSSTVSASSTQAEQATWQDFYPERLRGLLVSLAKLLQRESKTRLRAELMVQVAAAVDRNEQQLLQLQLRQSGGVSPWLIEGPFDSSYSLAILNRELARALAAAGINVRLHSSEGLGEFDPDPEFLAQNPDIADLVVSGAEARALASVASRLLYPPRVNDMPADLGLLHLFGWEEGELPPEWVQDFNRHLRGITTMSHYVRKVLIDNGVTVPQSVSGVGVDHWERVTPDPSFEPPFERSGFAFLHVSSCFPRKGVDVLLRAFGKAFTCDDDVSLIIKTFPNPHNNVRELLESERAAQRSYPDVVLIEEDLSDGRLKSLMLCCDALVAPSRGEGFGLPIAEAMLSGLPVIATAYGGHMDFCDADKAWLVDFAFARARTHFGLPDSIWAEPDCPDLARQLRAVYEAPAEERQGRAAKGRENILRGFSWKQVAKRVMDSALQWKQRDVEPQEPKRIGWVSSWNTRCGIAGYSGYLLEHFKSDVSVYASRRSPEEELDKWLLPEDGSEVTRCWSTGFGNELLGLHEALFSDLPEAVVFQFNYGFFEFTALSQLIQSLKAEGVVVVMMLHSTFDPPELPDRRLDILFDALARCDRLLVHSPQDLNRLKAIGLVHNTTLLPHGVIAMPARRRTAAPHTQAPLRLASFGFLLPHKGLEQLLDALALIRERGRNVVLHMLNAEYPAAVSREAIAEISNRIQSQGLESVVNLDTIYYTDEECLERLRRADLIVFPYQATQESSSAAVRHAIASGTPVAVTPLDIFDDVSPAVIRLPGTEPSMLATGIETLAQWQGEEWLAYFARAEAWRQSHAHAAIAARLESMLNALCGDGIS